MKGYWTQEDASKGDTGDAGWVRINGIGEVEEEFVAVVAVEPGVVAVWAGLAGVDDVSGKEEEEGACRPGLPNWFRTVIAGLTVKLPFP